MKSMLATTASEMFQHCSSQVRRNNHHDRIREPAHYNESVEGSLCDEGGTYDKEENRQLDRDNLAQNILAENGLVNSETDELPSRQSVYQSERKSDKTDEVASESSKKNLRPRRSDDFRSRKSDHPFRVCASKYPRRRSEDLSGEQ